MISIKINISFNKYTIYFTINVLIQYAIKNKINIITIQQKYIYSNFHNKLIVKYRFNKYKLKDSKYSNFYNKFTLISY